MTETLICKADGGKSIFDFIWGQISNLKQTHSLGPSKIFQICGRVFSTMVSHAERPMIAMLGINNGDGLYSTAAFHF